MLVLAEDAVVHQFRAVVADEHDKRVVPEAHVGQLVEQDANPLVDEGDVAVVQRLGPLDLGLGLADVALAVLTDLRQDEVPGLRVLVVAVGEVPGRVPVLVRGEAVDPEEEGRSSVIVLQEAEGAVEYLRREVVEFRLAVLHADEVLPQPGVARVVLLAIGDVGLQVDGVEGAAAQRVGLLPADEVPMHEPAGEVHVGLEHVEDVRDEAGDVALLEQHLGKRHAAVRDAVPAQRLRHQPPAAGVDAIGEGAVAGPEGVAHLDGGLGLAVGAVEDDGLAHELVEVGRLDEAELLARADDVGAKGVAADDDAVHAFLSNALRI